MASAEQVKALSERAMEGLTLPALQWADAPIYTDRAAANEEAIKRLKERMERPNDAQWSPTAYAVRRHPEAATDKEQWAIGFRDPSKPHDIDLKRVLFIPFNHGGPRIQACYYFEWDGD